MSVLNEKPLFNLNVEAANARYFIYLNDILMHKEFSSEGQISTALPVNHWMHPSDNTMAIAVLPEYDGTIRDSARLKVELEVHSDTVARQRHTIATIDFRQKYASEGSPTKDSSPQGRYDSVNGFEASDDGDVWVSEVSAHPVTEYEGTVIYQRELIIPSALPLWAFFNSDDLPDYDVMNDDDYNVARDGLFKEYEVIHSALERGDVDVIIDKLRERNQETDKAFYFEKGTTEQNIRSALLEAVSSDNHRLVELKPEYVHLVREENRKLVSLTRDGERAAIGYNMQDGSGAEVYYLVFRKQDGEWILTR